MPKKVDISMENTATWRANKANFPAAFCEQRYIFAVWVEKIFFSSSKKNKQTTTTKKTHSNSITRVVFQCDLLKESQEQRTKGKSLHDKQSASGAIAITYAEAGYF